MRGVIKRSVKKVIIGSRPLLLLLKRVAVAKPRVLVYHRFAPPGTTMPHRVSADEFAWQLDTIARDFRVISLAQCLEEYHRDGIWPGDAVVLTIDDGYRDMYQWAYPELLRRKMTATFFVTTRFIDGDLWLWPDRLDSALRGTVRTEIAISAGNASFNFPLRDEGEKAAAWKAFSDYCTKAMDDERETFVERVTALLEVDVPAAPPQEYGASTWSEVKEMYRNGIEIGAHTTTHPILSKIPPARLDGEIRAAKEVIERHLGGEVRTFCYPNSAPGDINDAVVAAVQNAGFNGAVFGIDLSAWEPYRVPRMGVSAERGDFLWKLYGGESLKHHA